MVVAESRYCDELVQKHADSIRANYPLEAIDVSVEDIPPSEGVNVLARTWKGHIRFNNQVDFRSEGHLETVCLHELGHRVSDVVNASFRDEYVGRILPMEKLKDAPRWLQSARIWLNIGALVRENSLTEGIADYYALDVLPALCDVPKSTVEHMDERRANRMDLHPILPVDYGYQFFGHIHSELGREGVEFFWRSISELPLLSRADLRKPERYLPHIENRLRNEC